MSRSKALQDGDLRRLLFSKIIRKDLATFVGKAFRTVDGSQRYNPNWHIDLIACYLEKAYRRTITRLLITVPPRSLKSVCASVAFPAWLLGQDPTQRIICASYSADLAGKHARDSRRVMTSDWYRSAFPRTCLNPRKLAELDFETTAQGFRLATSVEGTLTGRGGQMIIVDDPIKPGDALSPRARETVKQWFDGTLFSRLDDKKTGVIIVIMQRLHVDDLVGHLLEKGGWVHLNLPAIAEQDERHLFPDGREVLRKRGEALHESHEPLATLLKTKAMIGDFNFRSQYQQSPVPESGNLIRWEWFKSYEWPSQQLSNDRIVQSWDVAMTTGDASDWSVCTTWLVRGKEYYLLDVLRERLEFPMLKRRIAELKQRFGAKDVLVEEAGIGIGLIQQLRSEGVVYPIAVKPENSKADRMAAQSSLIEAGRVLLPANAPWLAEFRTELSAFPMGRHDDQVDSLSQFLGWIARTKQIQIIGMF